MGLKAALAPRRGDFHLYVTSSSSSEILSRLRGRYTSKLLLPFSFREVAAAALGGLEAATFRERGALRGCSASTSLGAASPRFGCTGAGRSSSRSWRRCSTGTSRANPLRDEGKVRLAHPRRGAGVKLDSRRGEAVQGRLHASVSARRGCPSCVRKPSSEPKHRMLALAPARSEEACA